MNPAIKRFLRLLIAVLVALALVSCQTENKTDDTKDTKNTNAAVNSTEENMQKQKETTEARIYPDLEAVDFGSYEFSFLTRTASTNPNWAEWDHRDIFAEAENGDVINDAVFRRNRKIEEKYNVTIKEIVVADPNVESLLTKSVKAGDDIYDVVCPHLTQFAPVAQGGNYLNFFTVPNLDLSRPWWDQGTIRDLSVINKLLILQGDLLILDNDAMEAMIFNKTILKEHELENPYEIVMRGEWTFDKLMEMSKGIAKDLNGDGAMYFKDDLFGCILQSDTSISFYVSGGEKICSKDKNDYPIITFGTEKGYRILDKLSELMLDEDNIVQLHRYNDGKTAIYDEQVKMFSENRALFSWIRMRIVERLRGMEPDFGIIPLPKLDKAQEKYITHNNPHAGVGISIPVTASNLERTGMVLEDLCAESRYTLQPAYYEINLQGKFMRDDESREMLDIILSNTAHDIGYVYNFAGFAITILHYGRDKKTGYASYFETYETKMQAAIDKTIEAYQKLD